MARMTHIEEEDLILIAQNAEQAAERQRPFIGREADVVRLVSNSAGTRQRHGPEHCAIGRRVVVEVDDSNEIWSHAHLVPRPDK